MKERGSTLVLLALVVGLVSCGGDGGPTSPGLDGDIGAVIQGDAGATVNVSTTLFDGTEAESRSRPETIPQDGVLEIDLEDGHGGYQVAVVVESGTSLTLQLTSDGSVIDEDSSPEDAGGGSEFYQVTAGETSLGG